MAHSGIDRVGGQLALDDITISLVDHHTADANAWIGAAHIDRCCCYIVSHNSGNGTRIFCVLYFGGKVTTAPVNQGDGASNVICDRLASIGGST